MCTCRFKCMSGQSWCNKCLSLHIEFMWVTLTAENKMTKTVNKKKAKSKGSRVELSFLASEIKSSVCLCEQTVLDNHQIIWPYLVKGMPVCKHSAFICQIGSVSTLSWMKPPSKHFKSQLPAEFAWSRSFCIPPLQAFRPVFPLPMLNITLKVCLGQTLFPGNSCCMFRRLQAEPDG